MGGWGEWERGGDLENPAGEKSRKDLGKCCMTCSEGLKEKLINKVGAE